MSMWNASGSPKVRDNTSSSPKSRLDALGQKRNPVSDYSSIKAEVRLKMRSNSAHRAVTANLPGKCMGKLVGGREDFLQVTDSYRQALMEFSSQKPLRVRVTARKPLVAYRSPMTIQQVVDKQKRSGSMPKPWKAEVLVDREHGRFTVPWRWCNTTCKPVGLQPHKLPS